jgi:hypothetical protein
MPIQIDQIERMNDFTQQPFAATKIVVNILNVPCVQPDL